MAQYIGIDLHKAKSSIARLNGGGQVLEPAPHHINQEERMIPRTFVRHLCGNGV
jgi:hypothetical protein